MTHKVKDKKMKEQRDINKIWKWGGMILPLIVVFVLLGWVSLTKNVNAAWFNDLWRFRQKISISSVVTMSNQQIELIALDTQALYNAGKLQANCEDLRFTDVDGNLLPYWVEENGQTCAASTAKDVWILIPQVYTTGTTIYMYYGNAGAEAESSGKQTFELFEDFNDANLPGWSVAGNPAVSGGSITLNSGDKIMSAGQFIEHRFLARGSQSSTALDSGRFGFSNAPINSNFSLDDSAFFLFDTTTGGGFEFGASNAGATTLDAGSVTETTSNTIFDIIKAPAVVSSRVNNTDNGGFILSNIPNATMNVRLENTAASGTMTFDWVAITKAISVLPTIGFGTEEKGRSPIVYLSFDEGQGQEVKSYGPKVLTGYLGGSASIQSSDPQWRDDCIKGNCLYFDGTNDILDISHDAIMNLGTGDFTVSVWTKYPSQAGGTNNYSVLAIKASNPNTPFEGLTMMVDQPSDGNIHFRVNSTNVYNSSGKTYNNYSWNHFVFIRQGTQLKIYVNGILIGTQNIGVVNISNTAPLRFGSNHIVATNQNYQGYVDEFKLWDVALTEAEILQQYNTTGHVLGASVPHLYDKLISWWKMDESTANSAFSDSSGRNVNASQTSSPGLSTGRIGGARTFNGTNQLGTVSSTLFNTQEFTISSWVYASTFDQNASIFSKTTNGSDNTQYACFFQTTPFSTPSVLIFRTVQGSTLYDLSVTVASSGLQVNQWNHVVCTYDGETKQIYINGALKAQEKVKHTINTGGGVARIGSLNGGFFLNGRLDDMKIFARGLSAPEIVALYNIDNTPNTYWKFDEKSGTTAFDSSVRGLNLATSGMTNTNWRLGKKSNALYFDGVDDKATSAANTAIDRTGVMSVSLWVNRDIAIGTDDTIFSKFKDGSFNKQYAITVNNNKIRFGDQDGGIESTTTISDDIWYHIVGTYNGNGAASGLSLYINGAKETTANYGTFNGIESGASFGLVVGQKGDNTEYFAGLVDDFKIWEHELSLAQVLNEFYGKPQNASSFGSFERKLTLSAATPLNDYQVRIVLNTGNFDYSKAKSDGADIRFYDVTGTKMNYWVESWNPAGNSVVWVKVPSAGTSSVILRYGDVSATSESSGAETFLFFTDLSSDPGLAGSNSVESYANYNAGGYIEYRFRRDANSGVDRYFTLPSTTSENNIAIDFSWIRISQQTGTFGDAFGYIGLSKSSSGSTVLGFNYQTDTDCCANAAFRGSVNDTMYGSYLSSNTSVYQVTTGIDGTTAETRAYQSGNQVYSTSGTIPANSGGYTRFQIYRQNYGNPQDFNNHVARIDDIRVRKFVSGSGVITATVESEVVSAQSLSVPVELNASSPKSALWKFDEKTGATANDSSGNNLNATLFNTTNANWVLSKVGNGLILNGTDQYATVPNNVLLNSADFTISAWIKTTQTSNGRVIVKESNTNGSQRYALGINVGSANKAEIRFDGTGANVATSTTDVNDGQWHHIVGTFSDTNNRLRIYVDGRLEAQTTTSQTPQASSGELQIGRFDAEFGHYFNGAIDNLTYWGAELSPRDIAIEYNQGLPFSWWKFDDMQGGVARDYGGSGLNGSLTNMDPPTDWLSGTDCKSNGCLDFDGTNDRIVIPHNAKLSFNSDFSYSLWFYARSLPTGTYSHLLRKTNGDVMNYSLAATSLWGGDPAIQSLDFTVHDGSYRSVRCQNVVQAGRWYHAAFRFIRSTNTVELYVNGALCGQRTDVTGNLTQNTQPLTIGSKSAEATTFWNGQIDEVKFWNYSLTPEDIKRDYNLGAALRFE
ncbi:MAG: DUF2341 domain-containing protein [Candidatus Dojkabacteria bacterium]|nr:MAG: DUF2341 domain-containing protein [Candidatus Dojkabacteria bacterium]